MRPTMRPLSMLFAVYLALTAAPSVPLAFTADDLQRPEVTIPLTGVGYFRR